MSTEAHTFTTARDGRGDRARPRVLITGGAGFIGTNVADRLLREGAEVRILDSLARAGTEANVEWLQAQYPQHLEICIGDIRDKELVARCVRGVDHVVHLAAQVAVTSSLEQPRHDFEVNVGGTINVLEAIRLVERPPSLTFCSTNKVYGALPDIGLNTMRQRYFPATETLQRKGVDEARPLDFHSPYGCSKGAADQYVLDYARSFGIRAVVLRMSCIYGPHQHGNEDQGWVAHFLRCALAGAPVTIYGDGRQVRDILFIDDLVNALECTRVQADALQGQAFNMGGGPTNTLSLLELLNNIEQFIGEPMQVSYAPWRVGDQKYYVSSTTKFSCATGWQPLTSVETGLLRLYDWLQSQPSRHMPNDHTVHAAHIACESRARESYEANTFRGVMP